MIYLRQLTTCKRLKSRPEYLLGRYGGTTHTTPDASDLVWKVADKVRELELQILKLEPQNHNNDSVESILDLLLVGE